MFSWLISYLTAGAGTWTYPLVFLLVMLDASLFIGFLLPGEAPVLVGGVLAGRGKVNLWGIGAVARWVDRAGWVFIAGILVVLGVRWLKGRGHGPVTGALLLLTLLAPTARAQDGRDGGLRYDELPNFHRVSERLYRGAQPRKGGIPRLASLGVNTIINLRDDDERAAAEEREAQSAGLRYFNVPFKRLGRPTDVQIEQVLSLIEAPENGVVFVHCEHGADRTGIVVAVYRISHDGWTSREAKREAKRYGMRFWQRGMKDYISDYYRDRPLRLNQPRDERRGRSVLPPTLRWSGLPHGGAVGVS